MYAELLETIARAIAKNHGFNLTAEDLLRSGSPRAWLYLSDAEVALELIEDYLVENEIDFSALEVGYQYQMPEAPSVQPIAVSGDSFPTWEQIEQWVDDLYLCWAVKRCERMTFEQYKLDKVTALEDRMNHARLQAFHHELMQTSAAPVFAPQNDKAKLAGAIIDMLNPHPDALKIKLYFTTGFTCVGGEAADRWANAWQTEINYKPSNIREIVLPTGFNPSGRSLDEIEKAICTRNSPQTSELEKEASPIIFNSKNTVETDDRANKKESKEINVKLFFDSNHKCLGLSSWQSPYLNYRGMYAYSAIREIPANFNPKDKSVNELFGNGSDETIGKYKTPNHTEFKKLTDSERTLLQSFVGREIEYERFRVIKRELFKVEGMKVGKMMSSQSDIKGWFLSKGKDKAALFWTAGNGWEVDCRAGQDDLTGVFEGFDLIDALEANDVEVNGVSANDWSNARDEEAEAEAIEAQRNNPHPE